MRPQRVRYWHTHDSIIAINPDPAVVPGYLHGSDLATGRIPRKRGSEKRGSRPRVKILRPPEGGWIGGA